MSYAHMNIDFNVVSEFHVPPIFVAGKCIQLTNRWLVVFVESKDARSSHTQDCFEGMFSPPPPSPLPKKNTTFQKETFGMEIVDNIRAEKKLYNKPFGNTIDAIKEAQRREVMYTLAKAKAAAAKAKAAKGQGKGPSVPSFPMSFPEAATASTEGTPDLSDLVEAHIAATAPLHPQEDDEPEDSGPSQKEKMWQVLGLDALLGPMPDDPESAPEDEEEEEAVQIIRVPLESLGFEGGKGKKKNRRKMKKAKGQGKGGSGETGGAGETGCSGEMGGTGEMGGLIEVCGQGEMGGKGTVVKGNGKRGKSGGKGGHGGYGGKGAKGGKGKGDKGGHDSYASKGTKGGKGGHDGYGGKGGHDGYVSKGAKGGKGGYGGKGAKGGKGGYGKGGHYVSKGTKAGKGGHDGYGGKGGHDGYLSQGANGGKAGYAGKGGQDGKGGKDVGKGVPLDNGAKGGNGAKGAWEKGYGKAQGKGKKGKKGSAKGDHSDGYPPAQYYTRKGGKDGKGKSKGKKGSKWLQPFWTSGPSWLHVHISLSSSVSKWRRPQKFLWKRHQLAERWWSLGGVQNTFWGTQEHRFHPSSTARGRNSQIVCTTVRVSSRFHRKKRLRCSAGNQSRHWETCWRPCFALNSDESSAMCVCVCVWEWVCISRWYLCKS